MLFAPAATLTFATKLATFVITAVTAVVLARALGPAARGEYALLILIPTAVVTIVNAGFGTAIVMTVGRDERRAGSSLTHAVIFSAVASVVGWIGALATLPLWRGAVSSASAGLLFVALGAVPALLLYGMVMSAIQGRRAFGTTSALILFSYVLQLIIQVGLVVILSLGLDGAVWGFVIAHGLLVGVALAVAVRRSPLARPDPALFREQLTFGAVTYAGTLAWLVLSRAGLAVSGALLAPDEVGRLAVALTLVDVLLYAADSVAFALAPHAAATGGLPFRATGAALRAVVAVSAAGAIVLFVLADAIVPVLFGHEYAGAASAVRWLLPGIVAAGIARVITTDLNARGRERASLAALAVAAVAGASLAVVLTRAAGVDGAAAATSAGFLVAAAVLAAGER